MVKICFITAISGAYEKSCKTFVKQTIDTDFICYTDNNNIINGTTNPVYIEFQKEYSDLINDDLEIQYKPIPLSILTRIETESVYPFILQNLITTE